LLKIGENTGCPSQQRGDAHGGQGNDPAEYFTGIDQYYYMRFKELDKFYTRAANGGPKNFKTEELDPAYMLHSIQGAPVHYLEGINRDIAEPDREE